MTGIIKTDKLQSSAGNDALTIASNGDVGVGEVSPAQRLEVKELDQTGFTGIRVNNPNGNVGSAGIEFQVDATYSKAAIYQIRAHPNGGGDLAFAVDTATDAANWVAGDEKLRVRKDGGITFNGDTAAANALDDYEEGSGDLAVTGTGGGTAATSGTPDYQYTKVGNLVSFQFEFQCTSVSGVSGALQIALPFTATDYGAGSIRCYSVTFDGSPFLGITNNTSQVYFKANKSGNATQSILSTGYYYGQITYKT